MSGSLAASVVVLCCLASASFAAEGTRDAQWKAVAEARVQGLPKTAIEQLVAILDAALKDQAYPEAVKALALRIVCESETEDDQGAQRIRRLSAALPTAPAPMQPVLQTLLAHWFWAYYQQNNWRFLERTQTATAPGEDFTTWDLPRIFAEIDRRFTAALAAEETLRATPIARYDALFTKGAMSDACRPTLYDFIAYEALTFYVSAAPAGLLPEDAFELSADSPIFRTADEFLAWSIATPDTSLGIVKAIGLLQKLLRFHMADKHRTALLDAELARLRVGFNAAAGENKHERYKAALRRFLEDAKENELFATASHALAEVLQGEGALPEAHRVATDGTKRFPNSAGGTLCRNLTQEIEAKGLTCTIERVWIAPFPKLAVSYRNLTKVYFRVLKRDWEAGVQAGDVFGRHHGVSDKERNALLAAPPALVWSSDLPPTPDFKERVQELAPPEDLAPGCYVLLASARQDFGTEDNVIFLAEFWVSDLALVIRTENGAGVLEGLVLDAQSGEPLAGAEVRAWRPKQGGRGVWEALNAKTTAADGAFRYENVKAANYLVHARLGSRALASGDARGIYRRDEREKPYTRTLFFTDRSLYRPGQTISYKALCIEVDTNKNNYRAVANREVTVLLRDANRKEVGRRTLRTNDHGSASGSFTAPRGGLMGRMSLAIEAAPRGETSFNVEEYKRPRFQVTFQAPAQAPKLGEETAVVGKALAYTGAAVDGAAVSWRVVRAVRYPPWWDWCYWYREKVGEDGQEIAHGTATTAADGTFTVKFAARPDKAVSEKEEPVFRFTVSADVTDGAGETRSAESVVSAGYTALAAALQAEEWQTDAEPVALSIRTTTLDGVGVRAEGVVEIHRLTPPPAVVRAPLASETWYRAEGRKSPADLSTPAAWPLGEVAAERGFTTDAEGNAKLSLSLPAGAYRALLTTQDRFGKPVTALCPLEVIVPPADRFAVKIPDRLVAPKWMLQPGEEFSAVWGSGYDKARAFVRITHRGKTLQKYWTDAARTQARISQQVTEDLRGGFTLEVTMVHDNRAYVHKRPVYVPWSNKELSITWERFVSKLGPGQKETWTAVVAGPNATRAAAEMVAGLYDASLDAYLPHSWPNRLDVFRQSAWSPASIDFENNLVPLAHVGGNWARERRPVSIRYRQFPPELSAIGERLVSRIAAPSAALSFAEGSDAAGVAPKSAAPADSITLYDIQGSHGAASRPTPNLDAVAARANLRETAFFFPHLLADADGKVKLEFTMPEALTEWRLMAFAHDKGLASGYLEARAVTSKDIMVQPNPPRFIREGDTLEFTVKVTNKSDAPQQGSVRLTLSDAATGESADKALGNTTTDLPFQVPARESRAYAWRLTVPDGMGFLIYKTVGSTGTLSDGEEGFLPVLPRRILVTESLPLAIRGPGTASFDFARLKEAGASPTLRHESLTVQVTSNPAWYAVMALPYLMEFPHECMEQVFNRYYANALARHIATRDPKIRRVFEQWKGTDALESPLAKNDELKAVVLEETPWVRQAARESERRRNVGILFDENRLQDESARALRTLGQGQHDDGAWSWFPGGRGNDYITLYITAGFARLRHLGVTGDVARALKALGRLDRWLDRTYREIVKDSRKDQCNLSETVALYLYTRTFFLKDRPVDKAHKEAFDYFVTQGKTHWLKAVDRQSQGHLALAFARLGENDAAAAIMRSLRERARSDPLLGMSWADGERSWWWYRAPIETQAVMIEAFQEVAKDAEAVAQLQVWLLSQKRTQGWPTTKATADAVYALLLRGSDLLASGALVEIALGGTAIRPEKVEAGTGYYERRLAGADVTPDLGAITLKKVDAGLAWGSVNWQYLEDMRNVTPYAGTPLTVKKTLYVRENTAKGPTLVPVTKPLAVGDALVVRIELRVDRDMEFVHLKDQRGSGTEPVNVLSGYRWRDGLGYYESTRDTASHFFIDYLPKGAYVLEYETRVVHKGLYQSGIAEAQCMYAPEFNGHSQSVMLEVK